MINFSKRVDLEYRDKVYHFKSAQQAVDWLYEQLNHKFSKAFIEYMFNSGKFLIDEWDTAYENIKDGPQLEERTKWESNDKVKNVSVYKQFKNSKHLTKQTDIYGKEFIYYDPLSKEQYLRSLDVNQYAGICILTSIYNAYPKIFDYSKVMIIKDIEELGSEKFDKKKEVIDYINSKYKNDLNGNNMLDYYYLESSGELEYFIPKFIDKNRPVVVMSDTQSEKIGHTTTFIGYDKCNYIIYDNLGKGLNSKLVKFIMKTIEKKIWDDYKEKNNLKKYNQLGLTNLEDKLERFYDVKPDLLKLVSVDKTDSRFIKINKKLFQYALEWIEISVLSDEALKYFNYQFMSYRYLTERLREIHF